MTAHRQSRVPGDLVMKRFDVFYQREGVEDIEHIVAEGDARLADIRAV